MSVRNLMQERQAKVTCDIQVQGVSHWKEALVEVVRLNASWARICGVSEIALADYVHKEAEVNNQSLERSVVHMLMRLGYQLEELEAEIDTERTQDWGRCVWYREHSMYQEPIRAPFDKLGLDPALFSAMFKTEYVGDQRFSLYSTQMVMSDAPLLHKTLVYLKVVFTQPKPGAESVAA